MDSIPVIITTTCIFNLVLFLDFFLVKNKITVVAFWQKIK